MLTYEKLDATRTEIRTLILHIPKFCVFDSLRHDVLQCSMETVSLDDYSPGYAEFLQADGYDKPAFTRAILWEKILCENSGKQLRIPNLIRGCCGEEFLIQTVNAFPVKPMYRDQSKYSPQTTKWNWGTFRALSYQWGDAKRKRVINVDGRVVEITENLEASLRHIRRGLLKSKARRVRIWVDALCINQDDPSELALQIKLMERIYSDADSVAIWIGSGEWCQNAKYIAANVEYLRLFALGKRRAETKEEILSFCRAASSLSLVASSDYWARLWIIQEVLMASPLSEVWLGEHTIPLPIFMVVVCYVWEKLIYLTDLRAEADLTLLGSSKSLYDICLLYDFTMQDKPYDLPIIMRLGQKALQTDPRDKIYGMMGLMDSRIRDLITPDQELPVSEVYIDFARSTVRALKRLDIIFMGPSYVQSSTIPSWAPDWSRIDTSWSTYMPCNAAADTLHEYVEPTNPHHLICQALRLNTISGLGWPGSVLFETSDHLEGPLNEILPSSRITPETSPYEDREAVTDALWDAITISVRPNPESMAIISSVPWLSQQKESGLFEHHPAWLFFALFQELNEDLLICGQTLRSLFLPPIAVDFGPFLEDHNLITTLLLLKHLLRYQPIMSLTKGYIGRAPVAAQFRDQVFVVMGCSVPLVLRPVEDGTYKLIGSCYVSGIMNGEALEKTPDWKNQLETVVIS